MTELGATDHKLSKTARQIARRRRWGAAQAFSFKRIRRWRDHRATSLIQGQLVTHRRASFAVPHKSRQRRH